MVFLSGCVKLNLLPEDVVKNSFKAGKGMYDESKLKRQGGEKREFSKQVLVSEYPGKDDAEKYCSLNLRTKLIEESPNKEPVVISEKVIFVDGMQLNVIECQLVGFVWTND